MKDIKQTLKALTEYYREWGKTVWKPYLALAIAAAIFGVGFFALSGETLLPLWIYSHETDNWDLILALVGVDVLAASLTVVGLVLTIVAAVFAHKAMRKVVKFPKKEFSRRHSSFLLTENVLLMLLFLSVAFMPYFVLFVSGMAAARSGLMLDEVATPQWVWWGMTGSVLLGVLLAELAMTFCRLTFRIVPDKALENTTNQTTIHEQTDADARAVADDLDGVSLTAPASNL